MAEVIRDAGGKTTLKFLHVLHPFAVRVMPVCANVCTTIFLCFLYSHVDKDYYKLMNE